MLLNVQLEIFVRICVRKLLLSLTHRFTITCRQMLRSDKCCKVIWFNAVSRNLSFDFFDIFVCVPARNATRSVQSKPTDLAWCPFGNAPLAFFVTTLISRRAVLSHPNESVGQSVAHLPHSTRHFLCLWACATGCVLPTEVDSSHLYGVAPS